MMKPILFIITLLITIFLVVVTATPSLTSRLRYKHHEPIFTPDVELWKKIEPLITAFRGDVAVYVKHFGLNREVAYNADIVWPTASIVKIPLLVGLMDKVSKGEYSMDQVLTYSDSQVYPGSGIMQFFKDKTSVEFKTLPFLMISFSDNVASLWSQRLAGGGVVVNEMMSKLGLNATRVNSGTPGREEDWKKYGWGQTSAHEICDLITMIRNNKVPLSQNEKFTKEENVAQQTVLQQEMYRLLSNHYYDENALAQIPPYYKTASKSGSLDNLRSEVVYVHGPKGEFVFSVLTNNIKDQRWVDDNEAVVLIRNISKIIYTHYNP